MRAKENNWGAARDRVSWDRSRAPAVWGPNIVSTRRRKARCLAAASVDGQRESDRSRDWNRGRFISAFRSFEMVNASLARNNRQRRSPRDYEVIVSNGSFFRDGRIGSYVDILQKSDTIFAPGNWRLALPRLTSREEVRLGRAREISNCTDPSFACNKI